MKTERLQGIRSFSDTIPPYCIFVPYSLIFSLVSLYFACNQILQELSSIQVLVYLTVKRFHHKYFILFTQFCHRLSTQKAFNDNFFYRLVFQAFSIDEKYLISSVFVYHESCYKMWLIENVNIWKKSKENKFFIVLLQKN